MTFVIRAKSFKPTVGDLASEAATPLEAIKVATEFLGQGMFEVVVLDKSDGLAYAAPLQLPKLFQKYKRLSSD